MIKTKDTEFTNRQTIFYCLIILVGLLLRWYQLDLRPFHHDESLHAVYGAYNYFTPDTNYYHYSPLLHGPLLYDLIPYFYEMLGATSFAARSIIALIGSLFLLAPLLFREHLKTRSILNLTVIIAVSPLLIYYSRFLREDFLVLSTMIGMLYAITTDQERIKSPLFLCSLALHYCIKENVFITIALLLGFLVYDGLFKLFTKEENELLKVWKFIQKHWLSTLIGAICAIFLFCFIYSARFHYAKGILDGLYRESLLYWVNQHNIERIKGPFVFQLLMISWYDLYFIFLMLFFYGYSFYKMNTKLKIASLASLILALALYLFATPENIQNNFLYRFFKLKLPFDVWWFFTLIPTSILVTTHHLIKKEQNLAWFSYLFYASFFTYSYVGEKVPWLSLYPLVFGLIYFVSYYDQLYIRKHHEALILISVFLAFFTLRITLITNFNRSGTETELISQVHTTKEFDEVMKKIKDRMTSATKANTKTLVIGDGVWPATWYLFNEEDYIFTETGIKKEETPFIIENYPSQTNLEGTHRKIQLKLRGWWVPEYNELNFKNFINYAVTHKPWNTSGYTYVDFFLMKNFN
jgi:uncharacterized protein (TIGR03663 family)